MFQRTLGGEHHRYAIAWPYKPGTGPIAVNSMYECTYNHTYIIVARVIWINRVNKAANPARGQLNRGRMNISLSPLVPVNLVSRDGFGSPVSRQPVHLHTKAESGAYLLGIPPEFRGGVHIFIYTAIRHRASPEFIGSRNCVPMAFTAKRPPAQGQ